MNREKALGAVEEAIEEHTGKSASQYKLTDTLDALDLDSLDIVQLCMMVEESLKIEILEKDMAKIKTVDDFVNVVANYEG